MPASSSEIPEETTSPSRMKRRLLWTCAVLGVLLLLALTPPLLNVNRLQRRIAASMSASLGRPVQLDNVTLHLLPVPGFTLQNLVVSEDPAFGSEPVIRANTVEVTLRPSSLWRRQVEISSIKFEQPSLNLVRNAQGQWNLQSLLMHAAHVDTAPTAQRKAGPEPRFPYIEATEARVNLKLGEEKKPFSLTEADFALWLTSPQEWRVRLVGQPARTDMNISDPGTVKLEGTLKRAATMAEVPVDLAASWEGAPLGEASKLLAGDDEGWRGNLTVAATLTGDLGAAKLTTRIHLEELRRTDFVPLETMDVHTECSGTLDVTTAVVRDPDCSVKTPAPDGAKTAGRVVAIANSVDLSALDENAALSASGLRAGVTNLSNAWLLDWARLFSQRIPAGERPGGAVAGSVLFAKASKDNVASWQGEFHGEVDGGLPVNGGSADGEHSFSITSSQAVRGSEAEFALAPVSLTAAGKSPALMLSGTATKAGYSLKLDGSATEQQVSALRALLPPLGDGLQEALPADAEGVAAKDFTAKAMKIDITCTRAWGSAQTCSAVAPKAPKKHRRR